MASLIIISWRDIPAQVIVKRGREAAKVQLSQRFQEAVDRGPAATIFRPRRPRKPRASRLYIPTRIWSA
jgi:hypothetical protein